MLRLHESSAQKVIYLTYHSQQTRHIVTETAYDIDISKAWLTHAECDDSWPFTAVSWIEQTFTWNTQHSLEHKHLSLSTTVASVYDDENTDTSGNEHNISKTIFPANHFHCPDFPANHFHCPDFSANHFHCPDFPANHFHCPDFSANHLANTKHKYKRK